MRLIDNFNYWLLFFLCCGVLSVHVSCMTLTGPVSANAVTINGSVTISSMTVSTMTIANSFIVSGAKLEIPGRIFQIEFSSTNQKTQTSNTGWVSVSDLQNSISLSKAGNYIMIFLGGNIVPFSATPNAYATIFRDSTNLGDSIYGLSGFLAGGSTISACPVGVTYIDHPGDTATHIYQPYIRTDSGGLINFPGSGTAYFILKEVSQ